MELRNTFTVPVPVDEAWRALLDIERIAPCMPGATVEEFDGETVTGGVKVKLGPVTVLYRGTAVFEERDETAHRMVLTARGKEVRGQGTATAKVTGTLTGIRNGSGDGTSVTVTTDLTVTGRPAQFGRGVLAEVADKLVGRFAECVSRRLGGGGADAASRAATPPRRGAGTAPAGGGRVPPAAEGGTAPALD
ncbi:SRPBCC family protein, partial [Streptomyces sp. NPDC055078]